VLLLDEPLSNLDAGLRAEMRAEIRALQQRLAITTVFVTHDQAEALAMSDRVAVMRDGALVEVATPQRLCDSPSDGFTASFLGARSVLAGATAARTFRTRRGIEVRLLPDDPAAPSHLVLRAARLTLQNAADPLPHDARFEAVAQVARVAYTGDAYDIDLDAGGERLRAIVPSYAAVPPLGAACRVVAGSDAIAWIVESPQPANL
jgi:putative spermidine/putrescine transport system ATP-binding protein